MQIIRTISNNKIMSATAPLNSIHDPILVEHVKSSKDAQSPSRYFKTEFIGYYPHFHPVSLIDQNKMQRCKRTTNFQVRVTIVAYNPIVDQIPKLVKLALNDILISIHWSADLSCWRNNFK